jgi:hypothetical protein
LNKLHANYVKEHAPPPQPVAIDDQPKRKPNFFDRKRFVDYEQNADSDQEKSKE